MTHVSWRSTGIMESRLCYISQPGKVGDGLLHLGIANLSVYLDTCSPSTGGRWGVVLLCILCNSEYDKFEISFFL